MNKLLREYKKYFEPKSIKLIIKCLIISAITCLVGVWFLSFYNSYYISINLYNASLIIFRTGLMIGLFPPFFTIVIKSWKLKNGF